MKTIAWIVLSVALIACHHNNNGAGDDGGPNPGSGMPACGVFGTACTTGATCCSGMCDPSGGCTVNTTTCAQSGQACAANTDCCSVSCIGGTCSATQCTSDGGSCSQNGECCGGDCTNGKCVALNSSCKTDGNACTGNADCCSSFCNTSGTCGPSSFCTQDGDSCSADFECCGGVCQIGSGSLGLCTHETTGATLCQAGVDGTVCNGCNECCSRLCEVYAPTGVTICQPAEGCRVNGDICHVDSDCCGAAGTGLPGDGNVTCIRENPTDPTGVCRNPQSCNPEGDVCHFKNFGTCGNSSARNDCCGGVGNSGVCQLDALGVPRCYGLGSACHDSGQQCAFAGDCCNGLPCIPNGSGGFVCGGSACQQNGNTCSSTADCCNGATCVFQQGQEFGMCGGSASCAQDGQSCSATNPCCNNDCSQVGSDGTITACPPGGSDCSCLTSIF